MTVTWTRSILDVLGEDERRELMRSTRRRRFAPNEVLFHQGDPGDALHLLVKGRVSIRATTRFGDVVTLDVLGPGSFFGELALLSSSHRRTATVTALEPVETISLSQQQFDRLRQEYPAVDQLLIQVLVQRIKRHDDQLVEALFVSARQRILRRLLRLAELYADPDGGEVVIPLSQETLASLAGTSRPTTNQVLRATEQAGAIAVRRSRIRILDLQDLVRRAG
jgi:CRP/FNR family cyclic AMP-dependent transcriptional regulator